MANSAGRGDFAGDRNAALEAGIGPRSHVAAAAPAGVGQGSVLAFAPVVIASAAVLAAMGLALIDLNAGLLRAVLHCDLDAPLALAAITELRLKGALPQIDGTEVFHQAVFALSSASVIEPG